MEKFFIKAAENFSNSLGLSFDKCKNEVKEGFVSKIEINGDLNFDVYILIPKKTLDLVSISLFGDDDYDLADLTNEIANLIIGNAKVVAAEEGVSFNISTPEFLDKEKIDYDKKVDLSIDNECFSILFKEK